MGAVEELHTVPFDDYLAGEQRSERRHEWVLGRVYVMAGGTERHDLAAGLVYEALAPGARRVGCRPFMANRKLRTGGAVYYPDVFVACGRARHERYDDSARLVVEVLSPSTRAYDYREKLAAYTTLPGLRTYVLVDPDQRRVEVATRVHDTEWEWTVHGPGEVIDLDYGSIDVDALYDAVDLAATT